MIILANENGVVLSQKEYSDMAKQLEAQSKILQAMYEMQQQMKEMQEQINMFSMHLSQLHAAQVLENKVLYRKATTDKLTQLQNREGMEDFVKIRIFSQLRQGKDVSVIMFDIDQFKKFNDRYGHDTGDKCLQLVAGTLKNNLRQTANSGIFRWGGEEMVVILPTDKERAVEIAERLRKAVEQTPLYLNSKPITVTVSGGVAQFDKDVLVRCSRETIMDTFENVLKKADAALYQAKRNGRNQIAVSKKQGRSV